MIRVTENFRKIQDLLAKACMEAGRSEDSVSLLAVSKKKSISAIREALDAGQTDFGENFVQEALEKIPALEDSDLSWHFIGHLQSNKTRQVAQHFDWVHTVDRLKLARRLSAQRPSDKEPLNVLIEVNIDNEPGKSGISAEEAPALVEAIENLPDIRLRGLMCIPAVRQEPELQRQPFAKLRQLLEQLQQQGHELDTLSMGMSSDFRAAILEGATIVRIGTGIFGAR